MLKIVVQCKFLFSRSTEII